MPTMRGLASGDPKQPKAIERSVITAIAVLLDVRGACIVA
jgi:hypothetical protein